MSLRPRKTFSYFRANKLSTAPASEPVTAAELRTHLNTDATDLPDAEADTLIEEAREWIENVTNIAFINQTWIMALDTWPVRQDEWWNGTREGHFGHMFNDNSDVDVEMSRWPLSSITGINVYDEDGNATAVTVASTFDVDTYNRPGRISLQRGASWPVALRANNAIEVTYVAGHGAAASDVPAPMKRAIKLLAARMYADRGDGCSIEDAYAASGAEKLMVAYQDVGL